MRFGLSLPTHVRRWPAQEETKGSAVIKSSRAAFSDRPAALEHGTRLMRRDAGDHESSGNLKPSGPRRITPNMTLASLVVGEARGISSKIKISEGAIAAIAIVSLILIVIARTLWLGVMARRERAPLNDAEATSSPSMKSEPTSSSSSSYGPYLPETSESAKDQYEGPLAKAKEQPGKVNSIKEFGAAAKDYAATKIQAWQRGNRARKANKPRTMSGAAKSKAPANTVTEDEEVLQSQAISRGQRKREKEREKAREKAKERERSSA